MRWIGVVALALSGSWAMALNLQGLEAKIQATLEAHQPVADTGVAVGVVHRGQLVFFKGYGYRDRALQLPVTEHTLFRIASNTKSFLSTSMAILADEGRLNFDQRVRDFLPNFNLESATAADQATLKDLLSHRVGLPRHDGMWFFTPFSREEIFQRLEFLEMNKAPDYGFRGKWQYNNLMYITLGLAAEAASGQTWQDLIQSRLLTPLGMSHSGFSVNDMNKSADFAIPYEGVKPLPTAHFEPVGPAGLQISNVQDLVQWVAMLSNKGRLPSGQSLVSEVRLAELFTPESEDFIAPIGVPIRYGLGWFLSDIAGRKVVWHAGNLPGFSTLVSFVPGEETGVIVLINQTKGQNLQFPWIVKREGVETKLLPVVIYEHLYGASSASAPRPVNVPWSEVMDLRTWSFPQARWLSLSVLPGTSLGQFSERAYGEIELYQHSSGALHINYYAHDLELKATPELDKYLVDVEGDFMPVQIVRDSQGVIVRVEALLEPAVRPIAFLRR